MITVYAGIACLTPNLVAIPVPDGSPPANVNGREAQAQLFWKADEGYVMAADGKTKIKAFRATGEIQVRIVDTGGNEFKGEKDAPIAQEFKEAVVIAAQKLDNSSNCHGMTFAGGKVWINNTEITKKSLAAMGFRQVTGNEIVQENDVGIFNDEGVRGHSVTLNKDTYMVRSKAGIEPYQGNVSIDKSWSRGGKLEVWTQRPVPKKK